MTIAIVTPTHKQYLDREELLRLKISLNFNSDFIHYFAVPENLEVSDLKLNFPNSYFIFFESSYFMSASTYNVLMLEPLFYRKFSEFKFVLILQTDAILMRNLRPLVTTTYDYIGAPWFPPYMIQEFLFRIYCNKKYFPFLTKNVISAGNGGLSLRNTSKLWTLTTYLKNSRYWNQLTATNNRRINEDLAIAYFGKKRGLSIADQDYASQIFIERGNVSFDLFSNLYGMHAPSKYQKLYENLLFKKYEYLL